MQGSGRPARERRPSGARPLRPPEPLRRPNAPVPRCRYRGAGARPSQGLTGPWRGAAGRAGPRGRGPRPARSGPASG
nr:MAG TPA: hypothetical protein [Caudoviricetes sp.]